MSSPIADDMQRKWRSERPIGLHDTISRRRLRSGAAVTSIEARVFADRWARHWNGRDVEAVLAHFAEHAVFASPVALRVTGEATIHGKEALRAYWRRALANHPSLRFTINRVLWDADHSELAIIYDREVNGQHDRGAEVLTFDADGRIVRGEAFYGVIPGPYQNPVAPTQLPSRAT
jgi:hypothetical protein